MIRAGTVVRPDNVPIETEADLMRVVAIMRQIGTDTQHYEVKSERKGLAKDIAATISAFSNGDGGTIILGLSEKDGFTSVEGFDPKSIVDALSNACTEKLAPPVRPDIRIVLFEGKPLVVANIAEMIPADKPCYIKAAGRYNGSYIRTGDGDRRLSQYEVDRLVEEQRQPQHDIQIVLEASMDDLDASLLQGVLERERKMHPRIFSSLNDDAAAENLRIARRDGHGVLHPTLAGLLALGSYPQKYFPRLNVSFACYPGSTKAETTSSGKRLVDSATMVGPIPAIVEDTIAAVDKNTRTGALIEGAFRKDVTDYPGLAVREAVVNALMHRDYSSLALGTPVQVDLYVDRLEITNPGGLFGNVTVDTLGKEGVTASRNQHLSNILESTPYKGGYVAENRGTGYQTIERELREALMPAAVPTDSIQSFSLVFERRHLSTAEMGLSAAETVERTVLQLLGRQKTVSVREIAQLTGRSRATVVKRINAMIGRGLLEPTEPKGSTRQRYRLSAKGTSER